MTIRDASTPNRARTSEPTELPPLDETAGTIRSGVLTRRTAMTMFAAITAAPAVAFNAFGAETAGHAQWEAALHSFTAADDAMNAFSRDHMTPIGRAYMAVRDKWPVSYDFSKDPVAKAEIDRAEEVYDPAEKHFDALVDVHCDACKALLLTPAPTIAELAQKLEIVVQHEVYEWTANEKIMRAISADAARLAGEGGREDGA